MLKNVFYLFVGMLLFNLQIASSSEDEQKSASSNPSLSASAPSSAAVLIRDSKGCKPQGLGIEVDYPQGKELDSSRRLSLTMKFTRPGMDADISYNVELPKGIHVISGKTSQKARIRAGEILSEPLQLRFEQWPMDAVMIIRATAVLELQDGPETVGAEHRIIFGHPSFDMEKGFLTDKDGTSRQVVIVPSRSD